MRAADAQPRVTSDGGEAPSISGDRSVDAGAECGTGRQVDYTSQAAPVLGGEACRANLGGFHGIGRQRSGERRGQVLGARNTVDDELGFVLGSTGVKHTIGLEEPSGLVLDQVQ